MSSARIVGWATAPRPRSKPTGSRTSLTRLIRHTPLGPNISCGLKTWEHVTKDTHFFRQHAGFQAQTLRDWYLYLQFPDGTVRKMTQEERDTQNIPLGA